jgi:hypothetical protein
MSTAVQVQYRRGTSSQVAGFTGAAGEMVVDTTDNRVVVQDGATAGGWPSSKLAETVTSVASSGGSAVTTAASSSGIAVTIGEPGGFLNKFRNGTMDVWQRGTSSLTAATSGAYTADGWIVTPTGASVTVAQAGGRLLTKNSLQVTGASAVTDVQISQRIESSIAAAFCSQTVTVQAQVYNNTGAAITPTLTVKRPSTQDGWSGTINIDVNAVGLQSCTNGAWTLVAYTFSANAASYNGLQITFDFGNNFAANSKTVQITECDIRVTPGASIGVNTNPPPAELRPIATELALCLRYYYQIGGIADYMVAIATFNGTTQMVIVLRYPLMRAAPNVSFTSNSQFSTYTFGNTLSSPSTGYVAPDCLQLILTSSGGGGISSGLAAYVYISSASNYIMLSAEL